MLLVDDGESKRLVGDIVLDQGMRADEEVDLTCRKPRQDVAPFPAFLPPSEDGNPQPGTFGQRRDGLDMLTRQNFRRCHQGGLFADLGDRSRRKQGHHRFARSHVALQQPQHAHVLPQVLRDCGGGLPLR